MGRKHEMHTFPWDAINYRFPDKEDIEAVGYIAEAMKANDWKLEYNYFSTCLQYLTDQRKPGDYIEIEKKLFQDAFEKDEIQLDCLLKLCSHYYSVGDSTKAVFYHALYLKKTGSKDKVLETELGLVLSRSTNSGAIYATLLEDSTDTIAFIIDNVGDYNGYFQMAKVCRFFGKRAIFVTAPIDWECDGKMPDKQVSLDLMHENAEMIDGVLCMTYIRYCKGSNIIEETLLLLLDDLSNQSKGNQLPIFAERRVFRTMKSPHVKRKVLHYVAANQEMHGSLFNTNFGYINGYANHESMLFGINLIDEIKKDSKHAYSIVIPVRNNSATLEYTLKTCLEQEYKDYEILVCDNSDHGNDAVPALLKTCFDSDRIRYIKTPRVLPITKSFEYAYLKARGDFLIPMGSDDGMLFNSLWHLDSVLKQLEANGEVNLLAWDRLHYVWPNLKISGQDSQFVVPRRYRKGLYEVGKIDSLVKLKGILTQGMQMYTAPLCYINSGMKRQYMLEILEKTGAILDGHSQDLYTGVLNLALNKEYYHLKLPITMAALSNFSSGAQSITGSVSESIISERGKESYAINLARPVQRDSEDLIMVSDGDIANLITQVFRLIDMECLDISAVNYINWESMGNELLQQVQFKDVYRKKVINLLLAGIGQFSKDTAEKLKKAIDQKLFYFNDFDQVKGKNYSKGFMEDGALILDASDFGVTNVYEACKLFANIYNIY
jgi:glycosyltransferase involved in cell wall biosynthesis